MAEHKALFSLPTRPAIDLFLHPRPSPSLLSSLQAIYCWLLLLKALHSFSRKSYYWQPEGLLTQC